MKYLIANWKSNKNTIEIEQWFKEIAKLYQDDKKHDLNNLQIVVCPPFIYLPLAKKLVKNCQLPLKLGAQNVSPFEQGAYTGEVTADMLSEFAEYVIVGHSERRNYFKEGEDLLLQKVKKASQAGLKSIFCIQSDKTPVPEKVSIVAYEPVEAIGTGNPATPETASEIAESVKKKSKNVSIVLYGGSVKPDNVNKFLTVREIDGVLVGGASLDPLSFWEMIINAQNL